MQQLIDLINNLNYSSDSKAILNGQGIKNSALPQSGLGEEVIKAFETAQIKTLILESIDQKELAVILNQAIIKNTSIQTVALKKIDPSICKTLLQNLPKNICMLHLEDLDKEAATQALKTIADTPTITLCNIFDSSSEMVTAILEELKKCPHITSIRFFKYKNYSIDLFIHLINDNPYIKKLTLETNFPKQQLYPQIRDNLKKSIAIFSQEPGKIEPIRAAITEPEKKPATTNSQTNSKYDPEEIHQQSYISEKRAENNSTKSSADNTNAKPATELSKPVTKSSDTKKSDSTKSNTSPDKNKDKDKNWEKEKIRERERDRDRDRHRDRDVRDDKYRRPTMEPARTNYPKKYDDNSPTFDRRKKIEQSNSGDYAKNSNNSTQPPKITQMTSQKVENSTTDTNIESSPNPLKRKLDVAIEASEKPSNISSTASDKEIENKSPAPAIQLDLNMTESETTTSEEIKENKMPVKETSIVPITAIQLNKNSSEYNQGIVKMACEVIKLSAQNKFREEEIRHLKDINHQLLSLLETLTDKLPQKMEGVAEITDNLTQIISSADNNNLTGSIPTISLSKADEISLSHINSPVFSSVSLKKQKIANVKLNLFSLHESTVLSAYIKK